ncbi:MAG: TRAP transporter small permease [Hyphomicrobiales bacterium]|nr:MAG: TRAP transporter small permease [Hyphomicrobiales bacterium]
MSAMDALSEISGKLCAWGFFVLGLFVSYEVLMRDLFTMPTIWVDEVVRVMQVWLTYLATAYVLKHREMITIDIAFRRHDTAMRRVVETFAILFMLLFAGVAAWYGFQLWLKSTLAGHTTDSFLALPKWATHASVWVGMSLLGLQGLAEIVRIWTVGVPPPASQLGDEV